MITLTGFTREAFNYWFNTVAHAYNDFSPFVDDEEYIVRKMPGMR
jgi:hypothetical protein